MLVGLTSRRRQRAAAFIAVLYALCLLAPVTAYALSDTPVPAHCLTMADEHQAAADSHAGHQHAMQHEQAPAPDSHDDHGTGADKCCGLFSVTAIAPALNAVTAPAVHTTMLAPAPDRDLRGRDANRIDRPPRSSIAT